MIKKLLIKVSIIVGIMMAVPYYFYSGGEMPGFLRDFGLGGAEDKPALPGNFSNVTTDKEVTVYQWVDEHGRKQFGSAPPEGVEAEAKNLKPAQNVISAFKIPEKEESGDTAARQSDHIIKNPYSPGVAKKLIDDAKNVQQLLDQRFENQNKIMGSGK
ncbi:MAG: DUF4124 domain-containing protein [Gammaproteobacteria bacterium]|nr:DUF4124 domain-containing protein [Gammaproteobacteria bacterium]